MNNVIRRISRKSAVQNALESIRDYIDNEKLASLPSEDEISKALGVSRLTVREAVTILEKEGVVSRIQGKGTKINTFVSKLENRIDSGSDIEGALRKSGYDVEFKVLDYGYKKASIEEAKKLNISIDDEILLINKVLYADQKAVAMYIDRVPEKLIKNKNFSSKDLEPSIFKVIEEICNCSITHDIVHIKPASSDDRLSKVFDIDINTPLISFEVFEYTNQETVLMYNTEYYTGKFVDFTICRNVAYKHWM